LHCGTCDEPCSGAEECIDGSCEDESDGADEPMTTTLAVTPRP
jgi:hypothetical protein